MTTLDIAQATGNTPVREAIPLWARPILWVNDNLILGAPGKRCIQVNWAVNVHKFITLFIIFGMMVLTANYSQEAWVYLALHGIYGYCWLIKDFGFRDKQFEEKVSLPAVVCMYLLLVGWYWVTPWLFLTRQVSTTGLDLFIAVSVHTLGVVIMMAADGQRHWVKRFNHQGLIDFGMFRYTRNPNYLGEVMLYFAYAYLADHWIAWRIFGYQCVYFMARMKRKDYSISRHSGWQAYKRNTGLLIPWAWFNGRGLRELLRG